MLIANIITSVVVAILYCGCIGIVGMSAKQNGGTPDRGFPAPRMPR